MSMYRIFIKFALVVLTAVSVWTLSSCTEDDGKWDPHANWQTRNALWYAQVADTARTAIAKAKIQYGDDWEQHCDWRMFKSLLRAQDVNSGRLSDSICVRIVSRGEHHGQPNRMPCFNDTVRISFRGWLMPSQYEVPGGGLAERQEVFTQTYYGEFNSATAAPSVMSVSHTVEGFSTALQYMTKGDDWCVYIPQEMGYGDSKDNAAIPAYSTLLFRIHLAEVYRAGGGVPAWQ